MDALIDFVDTKLKEKLTDEEYGTLINLIRDIHSDSDSDDENDITTGILKPLLISKELADFTGWNQSIPHTRAEATRYICKYIAEQNLQNPKDCRYVLIEQDSRLNALLNVPKFNPFNYFHIQICLKRHFVPSL